MLLTHRAPTLAGFALAGLVQPAARPITWPGPPDAARGG